MHSALSVAVDPVRTSSGRYELKSEIARGGMGAVYRAYDKLAEREVAYKRLIVPHERASARFVALFEREYNTLAQLAHPAIVDVYEYGFDSEGPFYTMELLTGQGLMELAPLPAKEVCRIIRDVASALSLLHARRVIHRDLSPANVRVNADGRTKLIDFGALVPFGRPPDIVGTPAFMPPEALDGSPLDQRADLYALGALAYWGLTRRTAVRARSLDDLPMAWLDPIVPPSRIVEVPEALETLIMSLLARDPMARPQTAAEVIERLTAIAELGPEPQEAKVAASYMKNPTLVGRDAVLAQLAGALKAINTRGGTFVVEAEPGGGKSALLETFKVTAQLSGATVLCADKSGDGTPFGVARSLVRTALALYPDLMTGPGARDSQFRQLLEPHRPVRVENNWSPVEASERQARTSALMQDILLRASAKNPLLLIVDELARADSESRALLATLASEAKEHPLMLLLSIGSADPASDAYAKIKSTAKRLTLEPLKVDEIKELVTGLFGGAANSQRLGQWLFEQSGGNPTRCMDLMRLLLQQEAIRYSAGIFTLPHDVAPNPAFQDMGAALLARLADLSPLSQETARLLSLQEVPTRIEHLARALNVTTPAQVRALEELSARAVASNAGGEATLLNVGLRDALAASLDEPRRRALHRALAHVTRADPAPDAGLRLQTAVNLLKGGEEAEAINLLTEQSDDLVAGATPPVSLLEALLEAMRRQGRSDEQSLKVLVPLVRGGWYGDMGAQRRHIERTLAALANVCGLTLTKKLTPRLGPKLGLIVGLLVAFVRLSLTPRRLRYGNLEECIVALLNIMATSTAAFASVWESERASENLRVLEPMRALGPDSAPYLNAEFCLATLELARCHFAASRARYQKLHERLQRPVRGMPDNVREQLHLGVLHGLAQAKVADNDLDAIKLAEELERRDMFYAPHAQTVLMGYYGYRGEMDLCELHQRKGELLALRGGVSWTAVNLMTLRAAYVAMELGDPVALVRVISEYERLSAVTPRALLYREVPRACLELLRGRPAVAVEIFEQLFARPEAKNMGVHHQDRVWYAKALSALGHHAEAKRVCEEVLAALNPGELMYNRKLAIQQLALSEAALGDLPGAAARLDALIEALAPYANPFWNGSAHRDRAKLALFAGDLASFEQHAQAMAECYQATRNAGLIQQAEQLRQSKTSARGLRALDDVAIAFETEQARRINQEDDMDSMHTEAAEGIA